jgi:putative ABC transport system ATP-binding protein
VLDAVDVRVVYELPTDSVIAVDGVSIKASAGELVALEGPSGSGKSTLLAACAGLEVPSDGAIHINGEAMTGVDAEARAALRLARLGVVFQDLNLLGAFTALENVMLPLGLAKRKTDEAHQEAVATLERLGMAQYIDRYPGEMSGGQQQRIAVARAIVARPMLILADEPTSALDAETGATVISLLREACTRGAAVVIATHDPRVTPLVDRVIKMREGKLAGDAA